MTMRCLDSRRLTGPNLLWDKPGAVLDVRFEDGDPRAGIEAWRTQVTRMLQAVNWEREQTCVRQFKDGASLAISAPLDVLYTATDVNEWGFAAACDVLAGKPQPEVEKDAQQLHKSIAEESNPELIELIDAASKRDIPILVDTDNVSIGLGRYSRTWPLDKLPQSDQVPWSDLGHIPVALVTGTNGKTTSVRLAAAIAESAGYTVGMSSTDWIAAGSAILDRGDYAGPTGARSVLRDPRVDLAILETARGGLLRRGLAVAYADVVLISNVAADHLGEFGVNNVDELADVKWVATRALGAKSTLVLNADDPRLVERAQGSAFNVLWFSPNPDQLVLTQHVENNGTVCTVIDGQVTLVREGKLLTVLPVSDIPITLKGKAIHNVYNVLGVTGLAIELGLSLDAIASGLRSMQPNDNPGRSNVFEINGAVFIVDFAHNPHGMASFVDMLRTMPARRRTLLIGQAGDRSDEDIRGLAATACRVEWDDVVIKEMRHYARGREGREVADILHSEFLNQGLREKQIRHEEQELEAVQSLVAQAQQDDLIVLLIHERRSDVLNYLNGMATSN
ncbi:MAG: Mur ligase family protein [Arenicellales bacterium]|nr:Mur ligase family protein [Arenicellales bacterium]